MQETGKGQVIHLDNRSELYLTGLKETISFDEKEVWVVTSQGTVHVKGKELHVKRISLEKGELLLEGTVDSIGYTDHGREKGKSIVKRMFQ